MAFSRHEGMTKRYGVEKRCLKQGQEAQDVIVDLFTSNESPQTVSSNTLKEVSRWIRQT